MRSLGEIYPKEIERVRDVLSVYEALGPVGAFGAFHIRQTLRKAEQASVEQDTVAMIELYTEMKGIE